MAVFKVAGVTFGGRQATLRTLYDDWWTEGREAEVVLELVAEVGNPHDPDAVRIQVAAPPELAGRQIGYVPKELAPKVRAAFQAHRVGKVKLEKMSYSGSSRVVSLEVRLLRRSP